MNASLLFVYGTLRDSGVQRAVFGRTIEGEADALGGHRLIEVVIDGKTYASLQPSPGHRDLIAGLALRLSDEELALADAYEGPTDYVRRRVRLESGRDAFVYLSAAVHNASKEKPA